MRGPAEHAITKPDNIEKGFASGIKSAHEDGGQDKGSDRIDNARLLDAINGV